MKNNLVTPSIPVGTAIIYYNKWTGFETRAFNGQFELLSAEEILFLKPGEVVYVDVDPLHPHGKVYGRIKVVITDIQCVKIRGLVEFRISYQGGPWAGFKTTRNGLCHDIKKAVDEECLAKTVEGLPLSKVIHPNR